MKITHNPPQSPPMVRYGDLSMASAFEIGGKHSSGCVWVKCDGGVFAPEDGASFDDLNPGTLVIPLDAELVIHGWADMSGGVEECLVSPHVVADLRAELDRVARERDVLREGLQDLVEHGGDVPGLAASRLLDDADRIRREAERGEGEQ